ncbi:MAG: carboxylesterase/lipase family protein [Dehalococcoidales bacterium]|nr:MAG: carboxylesterase/lipase family protein [Dehalococcoidales bacterium]
MIDESEIVAETVSGKIEGTYREGLFIFKGIPYAAPPIGSLRWMPPQPYEFWGGVRPAVDFSPVAPQTILPNPALEMIRIPQQQSEDCLYLNIWSPGLDDAKRPVMVWIHGGAFNMGSGSEPLTDGTKLASRGDVVVVSINYRLGLLGFLNLDEITGGRIPSSGNEGLLDQVAALRWVRDNISGFGGDPDNVTIFGESAGGMSIGCLLVMPEARGLFHKAILQSGVGSTVSLLDAGVMLSGKFLDHFGLRPEDTDAMLNLSVDRLLEANQELKRQFARKEEEEMRITVTAPVIDGKIIPDIPYELIKKGATAGITIIAGTNLEEWTLLCMMDTKLPDLDDAGLQRRLDYYLPSGYTSGLVEAYRAARSAHGMDTSAPEVFKAIQTDRMFRMPCLKVVDAQTRHNPTTYNYLFTWKSPALGGVLGACHSLDIGFVFGTYIPEFHGSGPAADRLSADMQDAWLAFARNGDPSSESLGEWLPYGQNRTTMIFGEESSLMDAPYDEERQAWEVIPDFFTGEIRVEEPID